MIATAVIAAGGSGTRFGGQVPKQFLEIHGEPLLVHTLRAFEHASTIDRIVLVLPQKEIDRLTPTSLTRMGILKLTNVVPGGASRQESVLSGLEAIEESTEYVAIHDAARCLATPELIDRTVHGCKGWDGAVAALPVRDTIKRIKGEHVESTVSRDGLWAMQTPQVLKFPMIRDAYRKAQAQGLTLTDDAAAAELLGARIRVVEGSSRNVKITYEEDLKFAEIFLKGAK